jgi:hypothetical protein
MAESDNSPFPSKDAARRHVWQRLRDEAAARFPFPIDGRIPNYQGAEAAGYHGLHADAQAQRRLQPAGPLGDPGGPTAKGREPVRELGHAPAPRGIDWAALPQEAFTEMPVLAELNELRG